MADSPSGPTGIVLIEGDGATLEITITPLTQGEERALFRANEAAAKKLLNDPYTNAAKALTAAKAHDREAWLELLERIAAIASKPIRLSQGEYNDYLGTPDGVARDLFARGRRATPELKFEELRTAITLQNVDNIIDQINEILTPKAKGATEPPTQPPSQEQ